MLGRTLFKEFTAAPEGIATNVLSDRLSRLVDHGLAERFPSPERKGAHAYRLTERGRRLRPVLEAIAEWGLEPVEGTEIRLRASTPADE